MSDHKAIGLNKGTLRPPGRKAGSGPRSHSTIRSSGSEKDGTRPTTFSRIADQEPDPRAQQPGMAETAPSTLELVGGHVLAFQDTDTPVSSTSPTSQLVSNETWLARNGHNLTFGGIFLFTLVLYFRPYELIPELSGFSSIALVIAVGTLAVFLPTQFSLEGTLTALPIEVKCVIFMTLWALLTIPIAKDPGLAWATFTDSFIKVAIMFIVMVNTLRTESRIKALMWLGIAVGIMLSWQALDLYRKGEFKTEGYRVSVDFGGMFGNPNDMSIHLVIFIPIAIALGAAAGNWVIKGIFFGSAVMMTAGSFVTQSRGGFLGLIAVAAVLVWKLGRRQRFKAMLISAIVGVAVILLAPGNYGLRILSIFIPSLDPVGSSDQRTELLIRSIVVSLRNPLGIGIGNFEIVGTHNLGTHNAFTQVSSELGWLAFAAYMIILLSPIRKLDIMERNLFAEGQNSWLYYLSIGVQASLAGYFVSSFFSSVAYNWYVYYPIAYAIGLRRLYQLGQESSGRIETDVLATRDMEAQHA